MGWEGRGGEGSRSRAHASQRRSPRLSIRQSRRAHGTWRVPQYSPAALRRPRDAAMAPGHLEAPPPSAPGECAHCRAPGFHPMNVSELAAPSLRSASYTISPARACNAAKSMRRRAALRALVRARIQHCLARTDCRRRQVCALSSGSRRRWREDVSAMRTERPRPRHGGVRDADDDDAPHGHLLDPLRPALALDVRVLVPAPVPLGRAAAPPRSHLARAARALDIVRALHRLRTGAGVRRGYATLRAAAPSLRALHLEYPE